MTIYRVLHISDFHFSSRDKVSGVADERTLKQWLDLFSGRGPTVRLQGSHCSAVARFLAKWMFENGNLFDLVVITGDLAATGKASDLAIAADYIQGSPRNGNTYETVLGEPTIFRGEAPLVVPGNHDRFSNDIGLPGSKNFEAFFPQFWKCNQDVRHDLLLDPDNGNHLGLVSADFTLRSISEAYPTTDFAGQGFAHPDVLDQLVQTTDALRTKHHGIGIAWLFHFPPVPQPDCPNKLILGGYPDVLREADKSGVDLVLAGHLHGRLYKNVVNTTVFAAGTACSYLAVHNSPNEIHILELEVRQSRVSVRSVADYVFDDGYPGFVLRP